MEPKEKLVQALTKHKKTVASCESLTAGLFTSTIASVPGASSVLKGGFVTYWTEIKEKVVHVELSIVKEYGVVSSPCAKAMAENTRTLMDVDYAVSFTGNAGPSSMENKPAGCVYCAIATKENTEVYHFQCDGMKRNEVRQYVVDQMIENLLEQVERECANGNKENGSH